MKTRLRKLLANAEHSAELWVVSTPQEYHGALFLRVPGTHQRESPLHMRDKVAVPRFGLGVCTRDTEAAQLHLHSVGGNAHNVALC